MKPGGKVYFASDFHLGLGPADKAREREKLVVKWLDQVKDDAEEIFIVGDVFDYWWEFRKVVPKGFTRFLGRVSELTDAGIRIHFFTGNHDMWIGDYLSEECGMVLHDGSLNTEINGLRFHIAHGHGLGIGRNPYNILLWIFNNRVIRKLFGAIHPRWSVAWGQKWSGNSRLGKGYSHEFRGKENEALFRYADDFLKNHDADVFVFGHRHLSIDKTLEGGERLFILGNWFNAPCYLEIEGKTLKLVDFNFR